MQDLFLLEITQQKVLVIMLQEQITLYLQMVTQDNIVE